MNFTLHQGKRDMVIRQNAWKALGDVTDFERRLLLHDLSSPYRYQITAKQTVLVDSTRDLRHTKGRLYPPYCSLSFHVPARKKQTQQERLCAPVVFVTGEMGY
jgi:hypothetical protein